MIDGRNNVRSSTIVILRPADCEAGIRVECGNVGLMQH